MTMSLDGFVSDRNGDVSQRYPDFDALRQSESLQDAIRDTGAVVMGRRAYEMGNDDIGDEFQTPMIIVVTHDIRGNGITWVTHFQFQIAKET
jgi:dihydrofolate reductase